MVAGLSIVSFMTSSSSGAAREPTPKRIHSLISHWTLDETAGSTAADSVGTNNGTLTNMDPNTDWVIGRVGGALDFDGNNDFVTIPDSAELRLTGDFSVACWMYKEAEASDWVRLVGKGASGPRNYGLWQERGNNDRILWQVKVGGTFFNLYSSTHTSLNTWYHVAGTLSGNTMTIYVNGVPEGTLLFSGTPQTSNDPVTIGYSPNYHTYWNGKIDDVQIFSGALTAAEVLSLAQIPAPAQISSSPVTTAVLGVPYSYQITANGFPVPTITVSALPAGLTFDNARTISGTPTAIGSTAVRRDTHR